MRTYLISADSRIDITGLSTREAATLVAGKLGKTSLTELLSGKRAASKGWTIHEEEDIPVEEESASVEHVPVANKLGIKAPTKGLRNRKPAIIRYYPTDKLESSCRSGDFGKYLAEIKRKPGIEATELADKLKWSRDLVMILAAKAKSCGLIHQQKESQAINAKRKEPGNLFLQSLTAGGYGAKMNVWVGKRTSFQFA